MMYIQKILKGNYFIRVMSLEILPGPHPQDQPKPISVSFTPAVVAFVLFARKLLNSGGGSLVGEVLARPATARAEEPESPDEVTSSRMSYTRFLEYLDQGSVRKVDLYENGTVAITKIYNSALEKNQRVKIQLPGLPPELLRKLKDKDVDFAANPMQMNSTAAFFDFL